METSSKPPTIKYSPFKSIIEASFFHSLSSKKLDDAKLSTESIPIFASYSISQSVSINTQTPLSLNGDSFLETEEFLSNVDLDQLIAPGEIYNLNTIQEFKKLDKQQYIKSRAKKILNSIKDGTVFDDPSLLSFFSIISFADLKKYKYTYWVMFPVIHSNWILNANDKESIKKVESKELIKVIRNWITDENIPLKQKGFFFLKNNNEEVSEENWQIFKLSNYKSFLNKQGNNDTINVGFLDPSNMQDSPGWPLRNFLLLLLYLGFKKINVICFRDFSTNLSHQLPKSIIIPLSNNNTNKNLNFDDYKVTGWERTSNNKLSPKQTDLTSLMDPKNLADQAVDLNLKLMKWRVAPKLDLLKIKQLKCLLLGAGTLGSYVSRVLLGWGVQKITFVDSGNVSFSNPVRQSLYTFDDCLNGGKLKAERASEVLKEIYPSIDSNGYKLEIPMAGHPVTNESRQHEEYDKLDQLISEHDVIFLLLDSREARWLPTLMAMAKGKIAINAALGFDSFVVMRHDILSDEGIATLDEGNNTSTITNEKDEPRRLGCYFCNDVVAPTDSISNQTLDQMCTVTRPGVALLASSLAVELLVSLIQHPDFPNVSATDTDSDSTNVLGSVPHQLRGFLHNYQLMTIKGQNYSCCSACSTPVLKEWKKHGWEFVKRALNDKEYIEDLSGLTELKNQVNDLNLDIDIDDDDDGVLI